MTKMETSISTLFVVAVAVAGLFSNVLFSPIEARAALEARATNATVLVSSLCTRIQGQTQIIRTFLSCVFVLPYV
jgi:hypothetical protein